METEQHVPKDLGGGCVRLMVLLMLNHRAPLCDLGSAAVCIVRLNDAWWPTPIIPNPRRGYGSGK
jgi:hypothetical protein